MREIRLCVAILAMTAAGHAAIISSGSLSTSINNPIPAGTTFTPGNTAGGGIAAPILFTTPGLGTLTITITDCCLVGDVYEVILDGTSIGITTPVAIGGPVASSGLFTLPGVAAGDHMLDVWNIVLSYFGETSPFGGTVTSNLSPAGLSYSIDYEAAPVPEPSTLSMAAVGLVAAVAALRRRRTNHQGV